MAAKLTVANSTITYQVEALYPNAQRIQGYGADNIYETEKVDYGEFKMGIDKRLSAGWVANAVPLSLTLQADSPSLFIFENQRECEDTNRTLLQVQLSISLPSLGKKYSYNNGYLVGFKASPGNKLLETSLISLIFESYNVSPI